MKSNLPCGALPPKYFRFTAEVCDTLTQSTFNINVATLNSSDFCYCGVELLKWIEYPSAVEGAKILSLTKQQYFCVNPDAITIRQALPSAYVICHKIILTCGIVSCNYDPIGRLRNKIDQQNFCAGRVDFIPEECCARVAA